MKNIFAFRSPIYILSVLLFFSCKEKNEKEPADLSALVREGYELQQKADVFRQEGKNDSALAYHNEAKKLYEKAKDSTYIYYPLLQMAEILKEANDYKEMQAITVEALKYIKPNEERKILGAYNNLGITYSQLDDPDRAIKNYQKGKALTVNPVYKLIFENNIAYVYLNTDKYKQAYNILTKAARTKAIKDSVPIEAMVLDNLGYAAFHLKKKRESDSLSQRALQLRLDYGDDFGTVASYLHLMETHKNSDFEKALGYAQKAEVLSRKKHYTEDHLSALKFLVKFSESGASKRYAFTYVRISDSLDNANRKSQNAYADIKYNFQLEKEGKQRAEADSIKSKLEASQEKNARLIWTVLALSSIMTGGFVLTYLIRRQKKIKSKAEYDTEVRISSRLHDDLANDVHRTIVFAETNDLSDKQNKETLLNRLDAIYSGTRSISHDNSKIPDDVDFGEYVKNLLTEYNSDERKVIAQGIPSVHWEKMERLKQTECSRIIKELLTNMRKHSDCTHAFFNFAQSGKKVRITYSDNGKGTDDNTQKRKNGLRIMENRISGMGGTATFDSEPGKGFRATIEIRI